jgi:hypothetical protein
LRILRGKQNDIFVSVAEEMESFCGILSPPILWLRCGFKNSGNAAEFDGKVLWSFSLKEV